MHSEIQRQVLWHIQNNLIQMTYYLAIRKNKSFYIQKNYIHSLGETAIGNTNLLESARTCNLGFQGRLLKSYYIF